MLFKLKFFEISCSEIERKEPGTRTLVTHEHSKRIGRCLFNNLDDITYDNPTVQAMCLAPLAANLSIMDIINPLERTTKWDASNFNHNCPFIRGLGLDHENWLVSPDDEFPNIYSELLEALKAAVAGSHRKIVTMETDVYVHSSVSDHHQFIENITNLYRPLMERIIDVTKVSISHPKESLRDASIGDSLELLTMRLRQRICVICHAGTDDILSDREVTCLPCSHLYHEDCIMLWLTKNSSCPVCAYRISFDEVECELPCDWPRGHVQNWPNLYKIVKRIAYKIQGSFFADIIWLVCQVIVFNAFIRVGEVILDYDLRRYNVEDEVARRAKAERQRKENRKKSADNKVLMHCKFNF